MTGVIVGRFQVPELHLGHIHLITETLKKCDKVIIILGCNNKKSKRNPYSWPDRVKMIATLFPQIDFVHLFDCSSDEEWSTELDGILSNYDDPYLFHSRDSFVSSYKGWYPTIAIPELPGYSGTKVRKSLKK